jgi:hypothetical protein
MDDKRTALERAFDIAKSGNCTSVEDVKHCLKLEGYLAHTIEGPMLRRQLQALIAGARGTSMPKGPKGQKRPADVIADAVKVMQIATGEEEDAVTDDGKDKAAQALGRKGGKARAEKMSAERRAEIAKNAAAQRWAKKSD